MNLGLSFDYLRIQTSGTHRLTNGMMDIDQSFDHGVKVWSDQMSVKLNLQFVF